MKLCNKCNNPMVEMLLFTSTVYECFCEHKAAPVAISMSNGDGIVLNSSCTSDQYLTQAEALTAIKPDETVTQYWDSYSPIRASQKGRVNFTYDKGESAYPFGKCLGFKINYNKEKN